MTTCIYCGGPGPFTAEHVLTRAFVGDGANLTLNDLVCRTCNTLRFSACEREWAAFPGLAMCRITYGPAGRKRKGERYRVHPGEHIYFVADGNLLAYEVEILDGLTPRIRAQVIGLEHSLQACADSTADGNRLTAAIDRLVHDREITAYKHRDPSRHNRFLIATVGRRHSSPRVCIVHYEWRSKPTNTWLDRFPAKLPRTPFYPRMSVDQDDRLRIRAENVETAVGLFDRLLNEQPIGGEGGAYEGGTYQVAVSSSSNMRMVARAVAKTAFNLAIHTLGAPAMHDSGFDRCRRFCWEGTGDDEQHPFVGMLVDEDLLPLPAEFQAGDTSRHTLMLTSNGRSLVCFIQLYGSSAWKVHIGFCSISAQPFSKVFQVDYADKGFMP
jgi:hypothetical protein